MTKLRAHLLFLAVLATQALAGLSLTNPAPSLTNSAPSVTASARTTQVLTTAALARSRSHVRAVEAPPATLAEDLRARISRYPFRAQAGAIVISLFDGRTIFESNADLPLTPASTMKVLTGSAILDKLGPDWQFRTRFFVDSLPVDGVVAGNLYVKGACEPDLIVEKFPEIAAGLLDAGIREVQGDIVADLLYFDGEERPPEWPYGSAIHAYAAPISALAANFSSVRIRVLPGPRPGVPATILVEPLSDAIPVTGSVKTIARGRTALRASRILERLDGGGVGNRIVVSGRIAYLSPPWERFLPIENPAGVAIAAVKRTMQQAGIVVQGVARLGSAPETAIPVFTLLSKPLAEIVTDMNKNSNNFVAEMLLRTLGAETYGPPGSRENGMRAVAAFLRTCGIDPQTTILTDGSGLSRSNRLSASTLARVLVRMWEDPTLGGSFYDSLPIAGMDGTLRNRMNGIARGRVRAKTGTIDGVAALAGYVEDTREGPVAFALIVNGASHPRAVQAIDDVCRILCNP